ADVHENNRVNMTGKGLKTKIIVTFAIMLILAMCLQSIVFIFLGVRTSIREDVLLAKKALQSFAIFATYMGDGKAERQRLMISYESLQAEQNERFSCFNVELAEDTAAGIFPCLFPGALREISHKAQSSGKPEVGFAGSAWNVFLIRNEVAVFAVPLINRAGQVIGTLTAERVLLPIYSRYEQDIWIALFYLLANVTIICSLCYFRMERILFRPLDRLVQKAENYSPDQQSLFLVSDDEGAFRKLSTSFNVLLDRIERDNRKLRQNVSELEGVNRLLQEKNDLVMRSEKLASVGRLSAGLAHEIGNPLSIIQGYIELLSRDDLNFDEKRQFADKAQQELDRIKRLIRQLLDFSGSNLAAVESFSVNAMLDEIIGFVSLEKSFACCTIIKELLAEHDTIVADKDALRQVLINCFLNAVDAMAQTQENTKEIIVSTFNEENRAMSQVLVINIKDNGPGIDEKHLQYIFDPFFTTKEVGRGTGLGLFVCHTIMEKLGGCITLGNRKNCGVEVRIEIPLQETVSA
ncbi:MAG: ATP-binding protein, partial [Pseudomonadota bacterium]